MTASPPTPDLYASLYQELRKRARAFLHQERSGHTLQPTEIVHEAWLRMRALDPALVNRPNEFLAVAGRVMRHLLVDYARSRNTGRRGGAWVRAGFTPAILSEDNLPAVVEVDRILTHLTTVDGRLAQIVELRFFAGLTEPEIARVLGISERTVKRDWAFAKTWIRSNISSQDRAPESAYAADNAF